MKIAAVFVASALSVPAAFAAPELASVFQDHMVLQRETPVPVWGKASPGEAISVEFAGQRKSAIAGVDGRWSLKLDALKACAEGRELKVEGDGYLLLKDVLVGEVWLASGQSNMWFHLKGASNAEMELKAADHPQIREFGISQLGELKEQDSVKAEWKVCSPSAAGDFSAVAYFFARDLNRDLGIPVGIIRAAYSGSKAEGWISLKALSRDESLKAKAEENLSRKAAEGEAMAKFPKDLAAWEARYNLEDRENEGFKKGWAAPDADTSDWIKANAGFKWSQALGVKTGGVFWVRKTVELPASAAGKGFKLSLAYLAEEYDTVYFNGVEVGSIGRNPPNFYTSPREYSIPGKLVKEGRNVIAARFASHTADGGLYVPAKAMRLPVEDPRTLGNDWLVKAERLFPALPAGALAERPEFKSIGFPHVDSALFNAMINPLIPYAIRGVIWFQGEDNATSVETAKAYDATLALLIDDWRSRWGIELPFLQVQLTNFGIAFPEDCRAHKTHPISILRDRQERVAKNVHGAGMIVAIDLGEDLTVHPANKQDVGARLELLALKQVYGRDSVIAQGPRFIRASAEGNSIRALFDNGGAPLMAAEKKGLASPEELKDGKLEWFEVAGEDGKYAWAEAKVDGDSCVIASSPQVEHPVAIRYAWAANARGCNLYNKAGLPAAPFRSDGKAE